MRTTGHVSITPEQLAAVAAGNGFAHVEDPATQRVFCSSSKGKHRRCRTSTSAKRSPPELLKAIAVNAVLGASRSLRRTCAAGTAQIRRKAEMLKVVRTPAAVRWIVPIPGTTKLYRLEENLGAAEIELT